MYQEESKKEPLPLVVVILLILVETIGLITMNALSRQIQFSQGFTEFVTITTISLTFYLIYKRKNYSYIYVLIADEFILKKKNGLKEKIVLRFYKNQILELNRLDQKNIIIDKKIYMTKKKYYSHYSKENIYYCIYNKNDYKYYIELRLSDKFYNLLLVKK